MRRVRGPGLQIPVGRLPSGGATYDAVYNKAGCRFAKEVGVGDPAEENEPRSQYGEHYQEGLLLVKLPSYGIRTNNYGPKTFHCVRSPVPQQPAA